MKKDKIAEIINKHLMDSWEAIEQSTESTAEHYACGWIDCCNAILKAMGEPTPTDLETVLADQGVDETKP
jgi:hypothetical protein